MPRSSNRPRPPPIGDDVLAYWYFYTAYDQLGGEEPVMFLANRLRKILTSIADEFMPSWYWGHVKPLPEGSGSLGRSVSFERAKTQRIPPDGPSRELERAADAVREEGRPVLGLLHVTGATRLVFPHGESMVEDFISSKNPGPWRGTEWHSSSKWLDEIIHFTVGDTYFNEVLHIAVKTNNSIWYHDWPGMDPAVAREISESNRNRLREILRVVRTVLPNAKVDHHSEGQVPSTDDGFAV